MPERQDWTREEVEAIVAAYLGMFEKQFKGIPINKAEENRHLSSLIDRSRGSIERKHENISAVLVELGYGYLTGYKPLPHYQSLLREVVEDRISGEGSLESEILEFVQKPAVAIEMADVLPVEVAPPKIKKEEHYVAEPRLRPRSRLRTNYLEIEARNRSLGRAGEEMIVKFEHQRLWQLGKRDLADRIDHVSVTKGDGLGFDILSFDKDGRERFIEVKTTRFGALTPFFASKNEVDTSDGYKDEYHLCRLFSFGIAPRFFDLGGSIRRSCLLEPTQFRARVG